MLASPPNTGVGYSRNAQGRLQADVAANASKFDSVKIFFVQETVHFNPQSGSIHPIPRIKCFMYTQTQLQQEDKKITLQIARHTESD